VIALFVAGLILRHLQQTLSGYAAILSCGRDPVEPVRWTFQHSPDSAVQDVSNSERLAFRDSSLIIHKVDTADSGTYNCTDAAGELHAIQLIVFGYFTVSCFKFFSVVVRYRL